MGGRFAPVGTAVLVFALVLVLAARAAGAGDLFGENRDHPWKEAPEPVDEDEIRALEFDPDVVASLDRRTGSSAELLFGRNADKPIGLAWRVGSTVADGIVRGERGGLRAKGYVVFLAERSYGTALDRIGVVKTSDPLAPVTLSGTGGPGHSTMDVLLKLRDWQRQTPFDLVGAGADWLEIELRAVPEDVGRLAASARELAPEAVGRDGPELERFANEVRRTRRVLLWWE
jgi:hypothetical protein